MIKPPKNVVEIDWYTSTMWFDEDGVLYSVPKHGVLYPQSKGESLKQLEEFKKLTGNKKVCMILTTDKSAPPPQKEDRDWIAKELDSVTKAMGIISTSPLSRMVANLFFGLKPPAYPIKFFSNAIDAKKWIRQYL
jgi:hypothetical protein